MRSVRGIFRSFAGGADASRVGDAAARRMSTAGFMRRSRPAKVRAASMQRPRRCAVRIDRRKTHDASMLPQFLERVKFRQPTPAAPDTGELAGKWLNGYQRFARGRPVAFPAGQSQPILVASHREPGQPFLRENS